MNIRNDIIRESFYFLSALVFSLAALDFVFKGLVSAYFNLNIIFLIWLAIAIAFLCIKAKK